MRTTINIDDELFARATRLLGPLDRTTVIHEGLLGAKGLEVASLRQVGNNRHLKLRLLQRNTVSFDAIAYNRGESLGAQLRNGTRVAAVLTPRINTWNGMTNIHLEIRDLKIEK